MPTVTTVLLNLTVTYLEINAVSTKQKYSDDVKLQLLDKYSRN